MQVWQWFSGPKSSSPRANPPVLCRLWKLGLGGRGGLSLWRHRLTPMQCRIAPLTGGQVTRATPFHNSDYGWHEFICVGCKQ